MITIQLMGHTCVGVDGEDLPPSRLRGKQRQVLEILALDVGEPVPKERIADLLWDGSPPHSYVGTLESYVCVLRRTLGLGAGRSSLLATTASGYVLSSGADVWVDLSCFRSLARSAMGATGATAVSRADEALRLVGGELLADVPYADWAVRAREVFGRLLVETCLRGAQHANGIGDFSTSARLAESVVERDPSCEDGWRQLMLAHWFAGRRSRALTTYSKMREAMLEQVGDEPGNESYQIYLAILAGAAQPEEHRLDDRLELATLLRLLRQALDCTPGIRAPACDSQLSEVAMYALSQR